MTVRHVPEHEYATVNGDRIAPEAWEARVNVDNRIYGPDIVVTVTGARYGVCHVRATTTGPYLHWRAPDAAQLRAIVDTVLESVGRRREGRRMPSSHPSVGWAWDYFTREA